MDCCETIMEYFGKMSDLENKLYTVKYNVTEVNDGYILFEVYDSENNLLANINPIEVPLVRSQLTIVRGEFLTSKATGGVGIVPDFDGEYNIVIP